MSKINDGGPAFPVIPPDSDGYKNWPADIGLTKREWFAGQAFAGILASCSKDIFVGSGSGQLTKKEVDDGINSLIASTFELADKMLAEREKAK